MYGSVVCACGFDEIPGGLADDGVSQNGDPRAILSLGNLCPALRDSSVEGGAGFYEGTQALFGYIIHMAAVVAHFEPEWLNTRLRILMPTGIAKPKIHYLILNLILNIAAPDFLGPYSDPLVRKALQRGFTPYRHKDWWYMNSYDSGMHYVDSKGPYSVSPSETTFAYWAIAQYGKVTKDMSLHRWGAVLAGTELYAGNAFFRVKEWNSIYPHALRYLGALGRVHESGASFETIEGVEPYMVFTRQVLPITPLSVELLESGWSLFVQKLWQHSCTKDMTKCIEDFGDIALAHINVFTMKWTQGLLKTKTPGTVNKHVLSTNHILRVHLLHSWLIGLSYSCIQPEETDEPEGEEQLKREIVHATKQVTRVDCFQRKQFQCGPFTLSNGIFFAAISQAAGGAQGILEAEEGNGRFRVY
ncbi:uncharacterized protein LOC34621355 [Cyclospora cayetanensis]|uniref:glucan endo-1,3-beta-D-glucosidase n=1 Tax=Cyclospora cayetanensis TaxID=88456 RepID=A0A6P6RVE9_9EIME|nr:uncharacterized protein LOC34621355 [Cyclospora cayetanensis]